MLPFVRRHAVDNSHGPDVSEARRRGATVVSVSVGLDQLVEGLGTALGDGFRVEVDRPSDAAVAVFGAVGAAGVRFLRIRHPQATVIVVDPADEEADSITAGAAARLERADAGLLADAIRSLTNAASLPTATARAAG